MKFKKLFTILTLAQYLAVPVIHAQLKAERQWPSYRGFMSSGVLDNADLPDKFDPQKPLRSDHYLEPAGLSSGAE